MGALTRENLKTFSRCDDISKITRFKAWAKNLDDISIFSSYSSKPINMKVLNLSGNRISDVSPIAELVNIEELYLRRNKIVDLPGLIKCLNNLPKLTSLWIDQNDCVENKESSQNSGYQTLLQQLSPGVTRINGKAREKFEEIYKIQENSSFETEKQQKTTPVARVLTSSIEESPNDTKFLVEKQCRNPDSSRLVPNSILAEQTIFEEEDVNEKKVVYENNTVSKSGSKFSSKSSSKSNSQPSHVLTASLALINTLNKTELMTLQSSISEILTGMKSQNLVSEMI